MSVPKDVAGKWIQNVAEVEVPPELGFCSSDSQGLFSVQHADLAHCPSDMLATLVSRRFLCTFFYSYEQNTFGFVSVALSGRLVVAPSAKSLPNDFQGIRKQLPLNSKFTSLIFICSSHLNALFSHSIHNKIIMGE